jgi:TetR/AcrR family transcriptional repressor of nem operon
MQAKGAKTHEKIIASAAQAFRKRGLNGTSIERLMKGANMTVGGFYAHFGSKQVLIAEVLSHVMRVSREELIDGLEHVDGARFLRAVADRYLSEHHRDHPETGCALPAVASEVVRVGEPSRVALEVELERFVTVIAARFGNEQSPSARADALAVLALCVGGLTLARAVSSAGLSTEILAACRRLVRSATERE